MSRMRDEDEDELDENFHHADIPNTFRELRACMTCSLIKTFTQFYDTGCENCNFLQMADNRQRVAECTSAYFEGMIAMMQPKESWVAKWQRIVRLVPGIYAVSVSGELPDSIKRFLEDRNIPYRVQN
ncbi:Transcription elongation factor SPT4 [Phytophthora megakarya]|uniref:DRB sensitivity-inducing factor small subunit n=1 Tax=Phytophthora megakarya TaxID=4795 RepID=A0A225WBT5_9STRA|nr:Transcription elongation factor SPT4 [Phytophthora megakarya]